MNRKSVVRALNDDLGRPIDPLVIDRIIELGATEEEIHEAAAVNGDVPEQDPEPSNACVAEIRALLAELLVSCPGAYSFSPTKFRSAR